MSGRRARSRLVALAAAFAFTLPALVPSGAHALGSRTEGPTPPRLARIDGAVSFWRPGAEDWAPAQVNTPLAAGDRVFASGDSSFEIELASRAVVRGGAETEVAVASLETGYLQLEVTSGRAALDFQWLPEGQRVEVDTPNGVFLVDHPGYYRVDVLDDETRFVVRRGGEAYVVPAGGQETALGDGQQIVLRGNEPAQVATSAAPAPDAWDRWNETRLATLPAQPRSAKRVSTRVAGVDDLDRYGEWRQTAEYGEVWVPQDVGPDWAPYTTGSWTYDPYYDWTWVDDAPWGWAPYHYGRWVNTGGYWGWAPGAVVASPVYAPALVGFVGGGGYGGYGYGYGGGVGVSVGFGSPLGWVALSFGEPCLPWWGPVGFRGRPWWGGWGGPRVVNNVYIDNRTIVNARDVRGWRNARWHNAVSAVRSDHFGRRGDRLRLREDEVRRLRPLHDLRVRPDRRSLVARDGRGRRPPDRVRNRELVRTRAPQDAARRLRAAGLDARDDRPRTRLVGTGRTGDRRRTALRDGTPPLPGNRRRPGSDGDARSVGRGDDAMRARTPRGRNVAAGDSRADRRADRQPTTREERRARRERARLTAPFGPGSGSAAERQAPSGNRAQRRPERGPTSDRVAGRRAEERRTPDRALQRPAREQRAAQQRAPQQRAARQPAREQATPRRDAQPRRLAQQQWRAPRDDARRAARSAPPATRMPSRQAPRMQSAPRREVVRPAPRPQYDGRRAQQPRGGGGDRNRGRRGA